MIAIERASAITVDGLRLSRGGRILFNDFSMAVPEGGKYLLNAPSGTGKTTLLRLFLGLEEFDGGDVHILGGHLNRKSVHHIRRQIAYLSQEIELPKEQTVLAAVEGILGFDGNRHLHTMAASIGPVLDEWELPAGTLSSRVGSLSGGERQRLGLAILEILERPLWILDEPTAALDEERGRLAARRIMGDSERTVLVISHDPFWQDLDLDGVLELPEVSS